MRRYKRIGIPAACLLMCVVAVASWAAASRKETAPEYGTEDTSKYEVDTNRHTQYVPAQEATCLLTTEGFEEKINNGTLSVWYSEEQESIRIVDLRTGYVWGCIDDREEYGLNKKWTGRATSLCDIVYYNLEGKEESAALNEGTFQAKYDWDKDGFRCGVSAKKLGISFDFTMKLDGDKVMLSMEDETIKETGKSRLASVSFLSFFGSVYEDTVPGYALVPDGSGALIRFQKSKPYQSGYSRKVYGNDLGIDKDTTLSNLKGNRTDDYATDEHTLALPVWGMVHGENQNGFLAMVDSGEAYTIISAIPAGAENETVRFTRAYATFVYRSLYDKRVSNSRTVTVPQEELNQVNPKLTYTFLTGEEANYSGMARECRASLTEQERLPLDVAEEKEDISLLLHVAGSEVKKGFLSNGLVKLTTAEQAEDILERLNEKDITNVSMMLSGWNKGGYHGAAYGSTTFEKKVGKRSDVERLRDAVKDQGGDFALILNVMTANKDQINRNRDAALNATIDIIEKTIPNKSLMYPDTYYVRHSKVLDCLKKAWKDLNGFDLLLQDIGNYLYSDYTVRNEITRLEALETLTEAVSGTEQKLFLDGENMYMLKYASAITNIPVSASQYVYETDSVPFLEMVLRGSLPYYAPYSNQGFYSEASILKMIEYGAYPSFMVMEADNFALNDTPMENYFSLNYSDWEEIICNVYGKVNEALAPVKGASIVSHSAEAEGVYRVEYDNGLKIWVNYNEEAYETKTGIVVPQGGYAVEE